MKRYPEIVRYTGKTNTLFSEREYFISAKQNGKFQSEEKM